MSKLGKGEPPLSYTEERTAKQLAKAAKVSLPTVYRRIQVYKDLGAIIAESKIPGQATGPAPTYYRLVKAP